MAWIFLFAVPIAVFFGVFFLVMHFREKTLGREEKHVPIYDYALGLIVAGIAGFGALVAIYLLVYLIPPDMSSVQAALDAQCGSGKFVAEAKGYDVDPFPTWYSKNASCENMDGKGCVCDC